MNKKILRLDARHHTPAVIPTLINKGKPYHHNYHGITSIHPFYSEKNIIGTLHIIVLVVPASEVMFSRLKQAPRESHPRVHLPPVEHNNTDTWICLINYLHIPTTHL